MAPAPSLGSGLSIVSAIAEQLTQLGEKLFWLISQPSKVFFGMTSPRQKGEQKANRERLRLEINVTQTKQKPGLTSNREKEPVFYPHFSSLNTAPPSQKGEQKANREPQRLETLVTHRKQNTGPTSNREKEALFQPAILKPLKRHFQRHKTPSELENHKIGPLIFVAIKNNSDPLFCSSYMPFLISPCSDKTAHVPPENAAQMNPAHPTTHQIHP
jgi:hypothetical protein